MNDLSAYIQANYNKIKSTLQKYCNNQRIDFDDDVFHSTLVKVLEKRHLKDMSDQGILNYIFMAFKINTLREKQYPYIARRVVLDEPPDRADIDSDELEQRIANETYSDFAAHYILSKIERNFDADTFNAYRLKAMTNMTYKQMREKTGIARLRQKVATVRQWLEDNITEDEIRQAYTSQ